MRIFDVIFFTTSSFFPSIRFIRNPTIGDKINIVVLLVLELGVAP